MILAQLLQNQQPLNPYNSIYQNSDFEISEADFITNILEFTLNAEQECYCPDQIEYLVNRIKYEQLSYVRLGLYYFEVLHKKLYLEKYTTFRDWCEHEVGRSTWSVKNYIIAADITLTLITSGFEKLPHNVSQCLALNKAEDVVKAWDDVLESFNYHEITGDKIINLLFPPEATEFVSESCSVQLTREIYEKLTLGAVQAGVSASQYITDICLKCEIFSLILSRVKWQT